MAILCVCDSELQFVVVGDLVVVELLSDLVFDDFDWNDRSGYGLCRREAGCYWGRCIARLRPVGTMDGRLGEWRRYGGLGWECSG